MTQDEKNALATRLRRYAQEYTKFIGRGTGPMVADLQSAATELENPTVAGGDVLVTDVGGAMAGNVVSVPAVESTPVGEILFPTEGTPAAPVPSTGGNVIHPVSEP